MGKSAKSYQEMKRELDSIMLELQQEELDVDQALEQYRRGLELVKQIEKYLKTAQSKVTELKAGFNKAE